MSTLGQRIAPQYAGERTPLKRPASHLESPSSWGRQIGRCIRAFGADQLVTKLRHIR